jgi:serine/threonine protein kinase
LKSLAKRHISRPDHTVVSRIAQSDRLLDYGSISTNYAVDMYEDVKLSAGSATKSYIGEFLGMKVNGSVFENFPFLLSAIHRDGSLKIIKILRGADGTSDLSTRQRDVMYEIESCRFFHEAIVPMTHAFIGADLELARVANCRVGCRDVLIMPWYTNTLDKFPSSVVDWIAVQGNRIMAAVEYLHSQSYVHMDIKAMNILVSHDGKWFLGDFGSCKPINEKVTSCSFCFCYEDPIFKVADVNYDWFMFLLLILIETLTDRRSYVDLFYLSRESRWADYNKVTEYATTLVPNEIIGDLIGQLLAKCEPKCVHGSSHGDN